MNEPGAEVGLLYLGAILSVLVVPAVVIAAAGRWTSAGLWKLFVMVVVIMAVIATLASMSITSENPADQRLYRGLIIAFGVSSAIAALVVDRLRKRRPGAGFGMFLLTATGTQFVAALVIIFASC